MFILTPLNSKVFHSSYAHDELADYFMQLFFSQKILSVAACEYCLINGHTSKGTLTNIKWPL